MCTADAKLLRAVQKFDGEGRMRLSAAESRFFTADLIELQAQLEYSKLVSKIAVLFQLGLFS